MPKIKWSSLAAHNSLHSVFLNIISSSNLTQLIDFPTRERNTLDLLFANKPSTISNISKFPPLGASDHLTIGFAITSDIIEDILPKTPFLDWKNTNFELLDSYFLFYRWESVINSNNLDETYTNFCNVINNGINYYVPIISRENQTYSFYPPHIQKMLSYRDKIKSVHETAKFRMIDKRVKNKMKKYLANREKRLLHTPNRKGIFNYIARNTKSLSLPKQFINKDEIVTDSQLITNLFANFFSSCYSKSNIPVSRLNYLNSNIPQSSSTFSNFSLISPHNVAKLLKKSENIVNTSPDGIPYKILKKCAIGLAYPVSIIFNTSFINGIVPSLWKKSFIKPIHKRGLKDNVANYRPIHLTCSLSKICERYIKHQLLNFLTVNNKLCPHQYGFIPKRSVNGQLIEFTELISNLLESKIPVDVLYLDIVKAFDSVPLNLLLHKLSILGINEQALQWIQSFLCGREAKVMVNDIFSDTLSVLSGVPQGSVLGPLLFSLYLFDLPITCKVDDVFPFLFADDLKIVSTNPDKINLFIANLSDWSLNNGLKISSEKSFVVYYGNDNAHSPYFISNNQLFSPANGDSFRDLGVLFTNSFDYNPHIEYVTKKSLQKLHFLLRNLHSQDVHFLTSMYTTYVRPYLEFSSSIFNPIYKYQITKIEKVQKLATRMICNRNSRTKNLDYKGRLAYLNLHSLENRRIATDITEFRKIFLNFSYLNTHNITTPLLLSKNPRTKWSHFRYPIQKTKIKIQTFFNRSLSYFHKLPLNLRVKFRQRNFKLLVLEYLGHNDLGEIIF